MRRVVREAGAVLTAAVLLGLASDGRALGDEPSRPTPSSTEANPAVPAPGHSLHGEAFDDGPRHAASLTPGMGKVSFPVTTDTPEAQAFVNQGVAQLHSFFYFEAERSFRQAARIDPGCALAYWGMAMANVNSPRRARGFLKDARTRAAKVSKRERLYLDALDALHKEGGSESSRKQAHLQGLETLVQEFPGDVNARAWLVMVAWQNGSIGSRQALDMVIDSVTRDEPMHPGAHHYRIHLWDGAKPSRAEGSAALYGKTAPGIAHAWHMPGHTYTSLHRYADAAYQQEASARVDHAYMNRDRVMPFEIHNYAHNNQWLATSLSHVGRARDAVAVARNLVDQPRDPNKNGKNDGGAAQRSGRLRWAEVLTRYELWDDLIAATTTAALDWSDVPAERQEKAYTLGLAYAAKGDQGKLSAQIEALKALAAENAKAKPGTATESAIAELEGHQLLAKGDLGPAFERFAKATSMRPEALARAHLKARNFGFAESTAKSAVETQPNQVAPLVAQVEILEACGKTKAAMDVFRTLEPLAKWADADTPAFQRVAKLRQRWPADKPGKTDPPPSPISSADRVALDTLGPLIWSPFPAESIALADTRGTTWDLADHKGKNVVVLFFLGGKCPHCLQQLNIFGKAMGDLKKVNTEVVAVSSDDPAATKALVENKDGVKFPMPLLADPGHDAFKRFRAYDDFEGHPLHGIFLVDADGRVRFQRISAEPFLDAEFLKAEAARVDRVVKPVAVASGRK